MSYADHVKSLTEIQVKIVWRFQTLCYFKFYADCCIPLANVYNVMLRLKRYF